LNYFRDNLSHILSDLHNTYGFKCFGFTEVGAYETDMLGLEAQARNASFTLFSTVMKNNTPNPDRRLAKAGIIIALHQDLNHLEMTVTTDMDLHAITLYLGSTTEWIMAHTFFYLQTINTKTPEKARSTKAAFRAGVLAVRKAHETAKAQGFAWFAHGDANACPDPAWRRKIINAP
jgi:hypothetical protein